MKISDYDLQDHQKITGKTKADQYSQVSFSLDLSSSNAPKLSTTHLELVPISKKSTEIIQLIEELSTTAAGRD